MKFVDPKSYIIENFFPFNLLCMKMFSHASWRSNMLLFVGIHRGANITKEAKTAVQVGENDTDEKRDVWFRLQIV